MISERQLRLLSEAVSDAASWRGSLVGAAPACVVDEFDGRIERMRVAVKAARETRRALLRVKPFCTHCQGRGVVKCGKYETMTCPECNGK